MRAILFAAFLTAITSADAHAEFINNYSEWRNLGKTDKALYAAGLLDGGGVLQKLDIKNNSALARTDGMLRCVGDNHLNGEMLSEMIDNAYARDVSKWSNPPDYILESEMEKLCKPWLDRSRNRLDPPQ